jgi:hypothetical protein
MPICEGMPTMPKEKFYSHASYCWNGIFGTIGSDKRVVSRKNKHYLWWRKRLLNCKSAPWRCFKKWECAFGIWIQNHMISTLRMCRICLTSVLYVRKTVIGRKHEQDIFDMAGSGFESTVRLAKSSPAMWTPF